MDLFKRKEQYNIMYTRILTVAAVALLGLSTATVTPVLANDHEPAAAEAPAAAADTAAKPAENAAPAEEKKEGEDKDGDGKPDETAPAPAPAPEGTTE